ncbi:metal-dependent transcriptional regulator [Agreia pratensis]|uniref:metal-dependent transcriptional regulator n=1 Tax=Agreia pratensis TaxID=150121 RepID=UPI00188D2807|nr:metal-dependent transcriptional regulator [Agreia pratensis]MBF4634916.1 metal-dependent transcriptional regulator [Agreia pratensis]
MSIPEPVARRTQPNADSAAEDYLKTIYHHTEWQSAPVTPSVLAATMGVAPSSVTEMAKKLSAAGLVNYEPYKPLTLTPEGTARARGVIRRHRLIETWLVDEMGYDWHEVHDEAEVLEHSISDRLLDAIDSRLGHPTRDPHGDPIPSADGSVENSPALLLSQAAVGTSGMVVRISDRDPSLLLSLAAAGIRPSTTLSVVSRDASAGFIVRVAGASDSDAGGGPLVPVSASGGSSIWISAPA